MANYKQTTDQYKEKVYNKYGDAVVIIGEYYGDTKPIEFSYHCIEHGDIHKSINAKNILSSSFQPCDLCASNLKSLKGLSRLNAKEDQYNRLKLHCENKGGSLISTEWTRAKDLYEIDCGNPDHPNFYNNADKILNSNQWCPYCYGRKGNFQERYKQLIESKNGDMLSDYINQNTHIRVRCKEHNYIWDISPTNLNKGRWCPVCNLWESEKIAYDCLMNNNLIFDIQYSFDDFTGETCEKYRFDFVVFINNKIILIEVDGDFHRKCFTKDRTMQVQEYDELKNQYCKSKKIPLIRVPYYNNKKPTYDEFYAEFNDVVQKEIINKYSIVV